ncbi:MAG: hypothetical protein JRH18_07910 [Deltaproteobacteria bacterium]|nr:hypothetical protein [Deltaproteobacteria bacterium]MBW1960839.1 hypothetical protein [Deltaproteobacteria bacterium]MBW1994323.1 hypothetical protein [Deltaproteobacteria bacterium]MBW2151576.1 hypothetical protein [Deltaproteobacteria bacterium]
MRTLSKCEMIRESSEIDIVSATNNKYNTKIRDRKMDIKELVEKKTMLGLTEYENVNYLLGIKRIIGMERLPECQKLIEG